MTNIITPSPETTSRDIARLAKVSVGTVYRVISNEPNVNKELRERVLKVMQDLNYIHVPKKRPLEPGQTSVGGPAAIKTVTFCVPVSKPAGTALQDALRGVEAECAANNISLHFTVLRDAPESIVQIKNIIQRGDAEGIVLLNYSSEELVQSILGLNIPVIVIDPRAKFERLVNTVTSDTQEGAIIAAEHLLRLGHRELAMVNSPFAYPAQRRLRGYRIALGEAGIALRPEMVVNCELSVAGGEKALAELLERGQNFTAVSCANDLAAIGVIKALTLAGKRVPHDVSVTGYDNLEAATLVSPGLTTVHSDNEGKGRIAIQRLLDIASRSQSDIVRTVLPVHLVERDSTAPPKP